MALLTNRFQFIFYGVCDNGVDICQPQSVESFLNKKPEYRQYITDTVRLFAHLYIERE